MMEWGAREVQHAQMTMPVTGGWHSCSGDAIEHWMVTYQLAGTRKGFLGFSRLSYLLYWHQRHDHGQGVSPFLAAATSRLIDLLPVYPSFFSFSLFSLLISLPPPTPHPLPYSSCIVSYGRTQLKSLDIWVRHNSNGVIGLDMHLKRYRALQNNTAALTDSTPLHILVYVI